MADLDAKGLATQLESLWKADDWEAATALVEESRANQAQLFSDPDFGPTLRAQISYIRGWITLQGRMAHLVGDDPHPSPTQSRDLLLITQPDSGLAARWAASGQAITEVAIDWHTAESPQPARFSADLVHEWDLPLDRYVDQAVELVTARAIGLGAPIIVTEGPPWLAAVAAASAHRLGLSVWWDLRGKHDLIEMIARGRPATSVHQSPVTDAAFRAAASMSRLVIQAPEEALRLRQMPELTGRLLAIGCDSWLGAVPSFDNVWCCVSSFRAGRLPPVPRSRYIGPLRATSRIQSTPRIGTLGPVPHELPGVEWIPEPKSVSPEQLDAIVVRADDPHQWAAAKERILQARLFHVTVIALGLPEAPERPFADIIGVDQPVPRSCRTAGHQPQWGFVVSGRNATGMRMLLRAAGIEVPAPSFQPRVLTAPSVEPRPSFTRIPPQFAVRIEGEDDGTTLHRTVADLIAQTLHPSLFTYYVAKPDSLDTASPPAGTTITLQAGDRVPPTYLMDLWMELSSTEVVL